LIDGPGLATQLSAEQSVVVTAATPQVATIYSDEPEGHNDVPTINQDHFIVAPNNQVPETSAADTTGSKDGSVTAGAKSS
jgi:hypothetical protein